MGGEGGGMGERAPRLRLNGQGCGDERSKHTVEGNNFSFFLERNLFLNDVW